MLYVNRKGSWQRKVLINYSQAEIPILSLTGPKPLVNIPDLNELPFPHEEDC